MTFTETPDGAFDVHQRRVLRTLFAAAAEDLQEEQENVEDVEEDARGDRHRALLPGTAQAVEVEHRERSEDH